MEAFGSFTMMIVILLGVMAFEAQAYYVLFTPNDSRIILWIIHPLYHSFLSYNGLGCIDDRQWCATWRGARC